MEKRFLTPAETVKTVVENGRLYVVDTASLRVVLIK